MEGGLVSGAPGNGRLLNTIFYKVSLVPRSLFIPFYFNIACMDNTLTNLNPEVKAVRFPREVVIWFFLSFYT